MTSILPKPMTVTSAISVRAAVADAYGIPLAALSDKGRVQPVAFARQLAMALTYELTNLTLADVAREYNRQDHGTVSFAIKRVESVTATDPKVAAVVTAIRNQIQA